MEGANGQSKIKREIRFRAIKRIPIFERRGSDVYESMAAMDEWRREKKKKKRRENKDIKSENDPPLAEQTSKKKRKKRKIENAPLLARSIFRHTFEKLRSKYRSAASI